jgi:ABC-2 type transport system permease protein
MRVLIEQCRYEQRAFWRSPLTVVTSIGLTPVFLLLIAGITGQSGGNLALFLPGVMTISAMSMNVSGVAVSLAHRRDQNVLKRFYATPVRPSVILLAVVVSATVNMLLVAIASLAFVRYLLSIHVSVNGPLFLGATAILGMTFGWLGCALSNVPSQAVVAVTNIVAFPALFISGAMFPIGDQVWYRDIGRVLPTHFARQLLATPLGIDLGGFGPLPSLLGLVIWAVATGTLGVRSFRWHSNTNR